MSDGLVARLRAPLSERADLGAVLAAGWPALGPAELAERPVRVSGRQVPLGELFDLAGTPGGAIRFEGDLRLADRVGAGLTEGMVTVEGGVGNEAGLGMSGGTILIRGDAGARAGAAAPEARRGMTGGELVILGNAGPEAGARMRRGLLAIGGRAGAGAGATMIAGTVVIVRAAGPGAGLWSKRGSIVALGGIAIPPTYRYACTYRPDYLRIALARLGTLYGLPLKRRHLSGFFRRHSGDLADLGKGEILEWTAK
jgi:formylmethanofuran dehydrogenase subunit C